jgi:NAD(P)H dehydrogenase (quinone)
LTGDTSWTYPELAATVADVLGTPVTYQDLSPAEHAEVLRASGVDGPTIDFLVQLDADVAVGVSAEATDQLRHLIGRPTTPCWTAYVQPPPDSGNPSPAVVCKAER